MAKSNCINFNDFQMKIFMKILPKLLCGCWGEVFVTHLLMPAITLTPSRYILNG